eukprot:m.252191 g.252191  ORF g.252191 m.252191 type:complete len:67 (+) comp26512_c0_seq14:473-673(+)
MLELTIQPSRRQLDRRVATLWDSDVWDVMPAALSRIMNRPFHATCGAAKSRSRWSTRAGLLGRPSD